MTQLALETRGLGKAYRSWRSPQARLVETLSLGTLRLHAERWALRDVDLAIPRGGSLGIIGANGAGKSTLLKLLAGTAVPDAGRLRTSGCVAGLLELGAGFHPDFSGRENILMNGVLLGRSRREMRAATDAILAFAELEDAADAPVRTYSTGMAMRLGFATALGVEPDVLLLDEVFAVGDLAFQEKCVERLFTFREKGGTLVLCSHALYDLRQMCDDALWLRAGAPAARGDAETVTCAYAAWAGARGGGERADVDPGPGRPRIRSLEFRVDGAPAQAVASGDDLELLVTWENPSGRPLALGVTFTRQDRTLLAGLGTHLDEVQLEGTRGCTALVLPRVALLAGRFQVVAHLFDARGVHRHHELAADGELLVTAATREVGLVRLEHEWRAVEPAPEAAA